VPYDIEIVLVGLIADTHGLMRSEALRALAGVDVILHAGDVGKAQVLQALETIAPVQAVRGNTDSFALHLVDSLDLELEGVRIHVSHGHEVGSPTPERLAARYRADVIVYGHTHRPLTKRIGDVLIVNPGAAGPRRFDIKPSVAVLSLPDRSLRMIELEPWDNHTS
jgi:putative phosphoesterase